MSGIGNVGGDFKGSVKGPTKVKKEEAEPDSTNPPQEKERFSQKQRDKARDHSTTYTQDGGTNSGDNYGSLDADA